MLLIFAHVFLCELLVSADTAQKYLAANETQGFQFFIASAGQKLCHCNMLYVVKNRMQQCCWGNIVSGCQQY